MKRFELNIELEIAFLREHLRRIDEDARKGYALGPGCEDVQEICADACERIVRIERRMAEWELAVPPGAVLVVKDGEA